MYTIAVKLEGTERRRRNSAVMHILLGFFLIVKAVDFLKYSEFRSVASTIPAFAVGVAALVYGFMRKIIDPHAKHNHTIRMFEVFTLAAMAIAFFMIKRSPDAIIVLLFVLVSAMLAGTDKIVFSDASVVIDEEGVRLPTLARSALIPWNELDEVVVREDFVTVFHIKKKYLQFQVRQDLSTLEIARISAFCNEQLAKSNKPVES